MNNWDFLKKAIIIIWLFLTLFSCSSTSAKPTNFKKGSVFLYYVPKQRQNLYAVFVSGTFNNWIMFDKKFKMKWDRFEKRYFINLKLSEGRYEYKFIVNGEWVVDPAVKATIKDPLGGKIGVFNVVK